MLFYVINLEYATDRLLNFNKSIESNKLIYNRFKAIDGKKLKLSRKYFTHKFLQDHPLSYFESLKGSIACALSHCALWKMIIVSPPS